MSLALCTVLHFLQGWNINSKHLLYEKWRYVCHSIRTPDIIMVLPSKLYTNSNKQRGRHVSFMPVPGLKLLPHCCVTNMIEHVQFYQKQELKKDTCLSCGYSLHHLEICTNYTFMILTALHSPNRTSNLRKKLNYYEKSGQTYVPCRTSLLTNCNPQGQFASFHTSDRNSHDTYWTQAVFLQVSYYFSIPTT